MNAWTPGQVEQVVTAMEAAADHARHLRVVFDWFYGLCCIGAGYVLAKVFAGSAREFGGEA